MPSQSEVRLLSQGMQELSRLARRDLEAFWLVQDKSDMLAVREALEEFFPALIDTYGDAAAVVAGDWYEQVMLSKSLMPDLPPPEQINARGRWALTAGFQGDPDQSLSTLSVVTDELVKQFGRDVVVKSAQKDNRRYARVPSGSETCDFCLMTASRGFVYETAGTAGEMAKFHGNCDCVIVPDDGQPPDGYDPDVLYEQYKATR